MRFRFAAVLLSAAAAAAAAWYTLAGISGNPFLF